MKPTGMNRLEIVPVIAPIVLKHNRAFHANQTTQTALLARNVLAHPVRKKSLPVHPATQNQVTVLNVLTAAPHAIQIQKPLANHQNL